MWRKAHFIGIGGVGMSAVAKLLKDAGVEVSGSDEGVYPPISEFLAQESLAVRTPYKASNIPADADLIVIGKNAKLIPETNEEVAAAYKSGKSILSFPEVLAELSKDKQTIVVAGSYGKSTSAALLAHCLAAAGKDPSYFIGASPLSPAQSAKQGDGPLFVLEGDEYPSSNRDPRAKFLHYHPAHLLLTPLAHDHFNVFKTPGEYLKPFTELLALVPERGSVVMCTEGPLSTQLLAGIARPVVTYGIREGAYTAGNISWGERTSFDLRYRGQPIVRLETGQLGEHNIQNIVGVAALLLSLKLVTPAQLAGAVASFRGIRRRLDRKSSRTVIPVFEGFGSSYEKMRSAIAAMRLHFGTRRLLIIFEPHTFSWRTKRSLPQYDGVFAGAAKVFVFEPPHDGKTTEVSGAEIAARARASGVAAEAFDTPEALLAALEPELRAEDCILLSSSGAMGGLIESIPKLAEEKFPV